MANSPFDQRIINQLERPTSSDLNIAQGQINANVRAFARQLLQDSQSNWTTGFGPNGALGNSFIIRAAPTPLPTVVTMTRGVGFAAYAPSIENIDGITGLSTNLDYPVIYSQDRALDLSGVAEPAAGFCRRDVIAIRAIGQSVEGLTDSVFTDIYEPSLEAFQAQERFKTLTADLTGQNLEVIESTGTPTGALVYIKGPEAAYIGPESFETAALPTLLGPPYLNIAVINRYNGQTAITESDIVDYRLMVSPGGQLTITGSATVGATSSTTPGAALSNVVLKTPPGIKASIYKLGANSATETNTYALIVAGPRGIAKANMTCTLGLPSGSVTDTIFPSQVVFGTQSRNLSADAATVALLADPAKSSPVQTVAVGQPYHVFPFTVGTVENFVQSVTVPVTVTGGGSITIPAAPDGYPAGTYDVAGNTDTRTYYLNYNVAATAPTTGLQTPTYQLGTTSTVTESTYSVGDTAAVLTRVVGFVASSNDSGTAIPAGVWRLSIDASSSRVDPQEVYLKTRVYLYNGSADPESGILIGESDEREVPIAQSTLDFYIKVNSASISFPNRVYIALYTRKSFEPNAGPLLIKFGGNSPAVLETNIATATPTVTIPDAPGGYPAATYPVTGTAGTVTLSIPTGQPFFNPEATRFGTSGVSNLRTIPVNFTVTLNRS